MSNTFEIVTVAVSIVAALLCLTGYFGPGEALRELGRTGTTWFEHPEERELSERPSEDLAEEPLPRRPLRARY